MASETLINTTPTSGITAPAWTETLLRRLNAWKHARRLASELSDYNDRQLEDMGIARGEILNLAREDAARLYGI